MGVVGRWTLLVSRHGEAWTCDPDVSVFPGHGESLMPVVPCDEAAVERAARAICAEGVLALNGRPATWEKHADGFRSMALAALHAAGEAPKCAKCNDTGWCCADQPDPHRCRCGADVASREGNG